MDSGGLRRVTVECEGLGRVMARVVVLLSMVQLITAENTVFNGMNPGSCIDGDYQKAHPTPEKEAIPICAEWSASSCCNVNTTRDIYEHRDTGNEYKWDRCGPVSEGCKRYLLAESCFYECEPMLKHYEIPRNPGDLGNVPICGTYCDQWYDACRNDSTCIKDWLKEFYYGPAGSGCPNADQPCITYGEMYKNGEDMCSSIWSIEYLYEPSNKNCLVMQFSGENPNRHGDPYNISGNPSKGRGNPSDTRGDPSNSRGNPSNERGDSSDTRGDPADNASASPTCFGLLYLFGTIFALVW